jgi:nitrogen fixation NifU-like protein
MSAVLNSSAETLKLKGLYQEIILDHYRSPRNRGELITPPATRTAGFNPFCGDEVTVYFVVEDEKVTDIRTTGQGCAISQASASLMSSALKGLTLNQIRAKQDTFKQLMTTSTPTGEDEISKDQFRTLGELVALAGVVQFPTRIKCAMLAWDTLNSGIDQYSGEPPRVTV